MAFNSGKETKVLVNEYDLSSYLNNTDMTWEVSADETTTYGNDDRTYIPGLRGSSLSFAGFYDAATSEAIDSVVPNDLGSTTPVLVSYAPNGLTVGNRVYSVQSYQTNYSLGSPVDGVATIALDVQGTDKLADAISLHNLSAVTSDASATVYDASNSSAGGGVGYLHATAVSLPATGSLAIAIQDSPSCSAGVWADLIAFTTITCSVKTSERATVTGGVDRYLRGEWDFTAATTESVTFAITFERLST